jgi:hypothetical protein
MVMRGNRIAAVALIALASVYFSAAVYWQISAVEGLARTGGVGMWSDGIYRLTSALSRNYADRHIVTPDWGFGYSAYVLTGSKLRMSERYTENPVDIAEVQRVWSETDWHDGVFVLNAPDHRFFPVFSDAFLKALEASHVPYRKFTVATRDGGEFAEVFETGVAPRIGKISSSVSSGDERNAGQLQGLYAIESGWRWTQREFSITLAKPDVVWNPVARLSLRIYVPEVVIQRLGEITLSASLDQHAFPPQTLARSGDVNFTRDVPVDWLGETNIFHFSLSKALPPSASDQRELGIILKTASLEP